MVKFSEKFSEGKFNNMKTEYNKKDLIEILKKIRKAARESIDPYHACDFIAELVDHVLEVNEINKIKKKETKIIS